MVYLVNYCMVAGVDMAVDSVSTINLDLELVLMDRENPRHDLMADQREILNWHVNALGDKLVQLMRSIAKDGLSDIEKILVQPAEGGYVVKEGNRRVAAVKLLLDPSLCDDHLFRRKIESVTIGSAFNKKVDCVCCTDRLRVLWMMGLRHLGQQGGVGTSTWGAAEKGRHENEYTGTRYWRSLYFIDYALRNGLVTDQQAVRLNERISNLDRLVPSAEFKKALGVSYKDGVVRVAIEKELHDKVLSRLLGVLSNPDFNVSEIYKSEDKVKLLTNVLDAVKDGKVDALDSPELKAGTGSDMGDGCDLDERGVGGRKVGSPSVDSKGDGSSLDKLYPTGKARKQPDPSVREKLFIGSLSIPPSFSKCGRLYRQIDSLKLSEHGLVIACAARALVDISSQQYIDSFGLESKGKKNSFGQISLPDMVKLVSEHLNSMGKMPRELCKLICNGEGANPQSFLHPQALHSFMHGRYENSISNLRAAWERCYEEYLRLLWNHITEASK